MSYIKLTDDASSRIYNMPMTSSSSTNYTRYISLYDIINSIEYLYFYNSIVSIVYAYSIFEDFLKSKEGYDDISRISRNRKNHTIRVI